jgi:hypothetical protein
MISRIVIFALLASPLGACATDQAPRRLTVRDLERAKLVCRAPDATLHIDEHVSVVFPNDTPDRQRQIQCLYEEIRTRGYWIDQMVTENANRPDE